MTATLDGVTKKKTEDQTAEQQAAVELVRLARERAWTSQARTGCSSS